jgi:hypothetical protein
MKPSRRKPRTIEPPTKIVRLEATIARQQAALGHQRRVNERTIVCFRAFAAAINRIEKRDGTTSLYGEAHEPA